MTENVETFNCGDSSCGRKFSDFYSLLEHYRRRHPQLYKTYEKRKNYFEELSNQIENFEKDSKEMFIFDKEREEVLENSIIEIKYLEDSEHLLEGEYNSNENKSRFIEIIKTDNETLSEKENEEEKTKIQIAIISEEMIGLGSEYLDYNEIEEVTKMIILD